MKERSLGQGLKVPAIGLGCMGMSSTYGDGEDDASIETIRAAINRGVTLLDTADVYGQGHNETLVGQAIEGVRDRVVIATKFGQVRKPDGSPGGVCGEPGYVRDACERSLGRLGIDHIDLYIQHRIDPSVPIEETVGALADLVAEGKVGRIGLSEASAETVRRAHAVHPLTAVQTEYSLWSRGPEQDLFPTLAELGIGFVAYSPLGRGFLTGAVKSIEGLSSGDVRRKMPRFSGENMAQNVKLLKTLDEVATSHGCTSAQIALAWVLSKGDNIVAIPGTRRLSRLEENLAAGDVVLSDAEKASLESAFTPQTVMGERYPPAAMGAVDK